MTGIPPTTPGSAGPPIGPLLAGGIVEGGASAQAAACAGPFTADAAPFDLLLTLLSASPEKQAIVSDETTVVEDASDRSADTDDSAEDGVTPPALAAPAPDLASVAALFAPVAAVSAPVPIPVVATTPAPTPTVTVAPLEQPATRAVAPAQNVASRAGVPSPDSVVAPVTPSTTESAFTLPASPVSAPYPVAPAVFVAHEDAAAISDGAFALPANNGAQTAQPAAPEVRPALLRDVVATNPVIAFTPERGEAVVASGPTANATTPLSPTVDPTQGASEIAPAPLGSPAPETTDGESTQSGADAQRAAFVTAPPAESTPIAVVPAQLKEVSSNAPVASETAIETPVAASGQVVVESAPVSERVFSPSPRRSASAAASADPVGAATELVVSASPLASSPVPAGAAQQDFNNSREAGDETAALFDDTNTEATATGSAFAIATPSVVSAASALATPDASHDAARVAGPVREWLREMPATPGRHSVTLTLHPDRLGDLQVRVTTTTNGTVRAEIVATTPEAKAHLENSIEALRGTLAERGLRLEGFAVALDGVGRADAVGAASGLRSGMESSADYSATTPGASGFADARSAFGQAGQQTLHGGYDPRRAFATAPDTIHGDATEAPGDRRVSARSGGSGRVNLLA